jgi:hypothetical protein
MTKTTKTPRDAQTGRFVLGQRAFRKISAVEGIKPSKRLEDDLTRLKNAPADKRRSVLTGEYGKKK